MVTALSDDEDLFDFESEERIELEKQAVLEQIANHSLDKAIRKIVPVDVMAIFELKHAEETIDRCAELRSEIQSFIEIAFDSRRFERMFINFPKHSMTSLRHLMRPFKPNNALVEIESLEPHLSIILMPLYNEEAIFYEQLSEILKTCLMGKPLSDTEKHLFSTDQPFNNGSSGSSGEERRDEVKEMVGSGIAASSGQDALSAATSTSMFSLEEEAESEENKSARKKVMVDIPVLSELATDTDQAVDSQPQVDDIQRCIMKDDRKVAKKLNKKQRRRLRKCNVDPAGDNVAETIEVIKATLAKQDQDTGASEKEDRIALLERALTTIVAQPALLEAFGNVQKKQEPESDMNKEWQQNLMEMEKR